MSAVELHKLESDHGAAPPPETGLEVADAEARAAYRAEADDLARQIDRARRDGDTAQVDRLQADLNILLEQLNAAEGLGGRGRTAGAGDDRVRKSVYNGLMRVRDQIGDDCRAFADHLTTPRLRCGFSPVYTPPPGVCWATS